MEQREEARELAKEIYKEAVRGWVGYCYNDEQYLEEKLPGIVRGSFKAAEAFLREAEILNGTAPLAPESENTIF